MSRLQISLDPEDYTKARIRASELGVSFAEYVRRLVRRDLGEDWSTVDPTALFDLAESSGSDIARRKDEYIGAAVEAGR